MGHPTNACGECYVEREAELEGQDVSRAVDRYQQVERMNQALGA